MNKKERPPWLKVVGGKEREPEASKTSVGPSQETESEVTDGDLVRLYMDLTENQPADLMVRTNKRLIAEASRDIGTWSVAQLHTYLSQPTVWAKPSNTVAVFEEIRYRMFRGTLEPRE